MENGNTALTIIEAPEPAEKPKAAMTIKETAKEFSFPEWGIRTLVKQGRFPVIQIGNRAYIVRAIFEEYIKSGGAKYARR